MDSRSFKKTWTVWVLCLLGLLVSCQDTIPRRSTITPGSSAQDPITCPEGQELVEEEVNGETESTCQDKPAERPNNAVFWKPDFCACKDGKPVSYGNCSSFCSSKNTNGAEILYANFTVSEAISLGGLGNVYAWCKVNLPGDTANPECELQAKDENNNVITLDVTVPVNTNSITADIKDKLSYDKTYVLTLVEKTSGAKSNSVQIIKFSSDTNISILGPLKNVPVSQYSCMVRELSEDNLGDIYFDYAYRLHYYFIPRLPPAPIPGGNASMICHDIFNPLYGKVDQETYPRFERLPGIFNLWDTTDPRFYDNNGNGQLDVNEVIVQKTRNFGGTVPTGAEFFKTFQWQTGPIFEEQGTGTNQQTASTLGYFMAPWIDQTTYLSYCLNSSHYNSNNPLFKAMRDIIGVDTEGLYVGVKAPETVTDAQGNITTGFQDLILIRETDLKAVWFYLKSGVPTAPTDTSVVNEAVYFYYPLNKTSPYVRTSTQRIYRVYSAQELNAMSSGGPSSGGSTPTGGSTSYPPHDRKIGCVPKF